MKKYNIDECLVNFIKATITEGILIINPEGQIDFANNAAGCLLSQLTDGLEGQTADDIFGKGFFTDISYELRCFGDKEIITERDLRPKNGEILSIRCRIRPVEENGQFFCLVHLHDISEIRQYQKIIRQQQEEFFYCSNQENLSGLLNENETRNRIRQEIQQAKEEGTAFSVILLDRQTFRYIYEAYEYFKGAQSIQTFTAEIRSNLKSDLFIGRYDQENYIVGLPQVSRQEAEQVSDRIRKRATDLKAVIGTVESNSVMRFGFAEFDSGKEEDSESFFHRADENRRALKKLKLLA